MTLEETMGKAQDAQQQTTATWRVLKRTSLLKLPTTSWEEKEPLEITARYPYPNAENVGEKYGEGEYILIPTTGYAAAVTLKIVADKYYRAAEEDQ